MIKSSVKKPFTVLVAVVMIIALGFVSLSNMTADLLPNMSLPYMIVITTYPGASPEKVEAAVTIPLEGALGTVTGVEEVTSTSSENYSTVQLQFEDGTDMDAVLVKVYNALDQVTPYLPEEVGTPSIMEISMDMIATQYLAVSYDGMDIYQLSKFVDGELVQQLERLDGVASVSPVGIVEKTIYVDLNAEKVQALNDKILASLDDDFADALKQITDGKKQLTDSEKTLEDSRQQLEDSKQAIEDGRAELKEKWDEYNEGADAFIEGKKELEDGILEMEKFVYQLNQTLDGYSDNLAALEAGVPARAALASTGAMLDMVPADVQNLTIDFIMSTPMGASYPQLTALTSIPGITTASSISQAKTVVADTIKETDKGLDAAILGYNMLREAAGLSAKNGLKASTLTVKDVQLMRDEWPALWAGATAYLRVQQDKLEEAKKSLNTTRDQINAAYDQLKSAEQQLDDTEQQLADGAEKIKDGEKQLADGWKSYYDGLKKFEKQRDEAKKKANANKLLELSTLSSLIYAQNFEMPAGYIDDEQGQSWLIRIGQNFSSVDEISDSVLTHIDDVGDVRLCDVADITILDNSGDSYAKINGKQGVLLTLYKNSTASTNALSKTVAKAKAELEAQYEGLSITSLLDQGEYIDYISSSVLSSMLIGAALAVVILALFLKDIVPTLVVALSIPLSVLLALTCMYFSNITINMLTLAGLALGIGMLVDNSIVVIENIYRLRAYGISSARAAVQGTKQVAAPIISSTLTTICVFFPLVFTKGLVKDMILPMALTVIYCLTGSLLIAMTVVPAAGSTLLKNAKPKDHRFFDKVTNVYGKSLRWCLEHKALPLLIAIGLLAATVYEVVRMGVEIIPGSSSEPIVVNVSIPDGATREEAYKMVDEVVDAILPIDGIETVGAMQSSSMGAMFTSAASGSGSYKSFVLYVMMSAENPEKDEIEKVSSDIAEATKGLAARVSSSANQMDMGALLGSGLEVYIYGSDTDKLIEISEDVMDIVASVEGYTKISNGTSEGDDVIHLVIDRNRAMAKGLTVAQIYSQLSSELTEEATSTSVKIDEYEMDIVIRDNISPLTTDNILDYGFDISEVDEDGDTVTVTYPLGEFAHIENEKSLASVDRKNMTRYVTVSARTEEGYNATLLARELQPLLDEYETPFGYSLELSGESETTNDMIIQLSKLLALGFLFIYLIMVAQFQSLLSPFIVLFTIPLAFTGGMFGLLLIGEKLNIMSIMGFAILMGTVVNNGIVFVDFANKLRISGFERRDALVRTGQTRMRPILMTALTTILAMSKLIFTQDMGGQLSRGLAVVIMGGLSYATLMTLYIIPVVYDIIFKRSPLVVDIGGDDLDDIPDETEMN